VRFVTGLSMFSHYKGASNLFTDPLNTKLTGPINHIVLDVEVNFRGNSFDSWWGGTPRYFVLSQGFKMSGRMYPPFAMFPEPKLSSMPKVLLNIGPCRDEFDEKYHAGYCSSRKGNCGLASFKANCLKTCKACIDSSAKAVATPHAITSMCADKLDSRYGTGYCAARKQLCTSTSSFRAVCEMTCKVCGGTPQPTMAKPTTKPTASARTSVPTVLNMDPLAYSAAYAKVHDHCAGTDLINKACPNDSAGSPLPKTCNRACAKHYMTWYGECVNDPRIKTVDSHLHGGLHSFFLLCAAARQN